MNYLKAIGTPLKKGLPLRAGLMNMIVSATLIYFFIRLSVTGGILPFELSWRCVWGILFSLITINLLVQIINLATERSRLARIVAHELLILILWLSYGYYVRTQVPPDFSMITDNIRYALSLNSFYIIWSSFRPVHLAAMLVIMAGVIFAEMKFHMISRIRQENPRGIKMVFSMILYAAAVMAPFPSCDQATALMQGAYQKAFPGTRQTWASTGHPYLRETVDISGRFSSQPEGRPDIILVMMESFNANFVEAKTPDGREITPVFNRLLKTGLYFDRFYGNSIQTCRGQAATLLSVWPSFRNKIFTSYPNLRFKALPSYLADAGYDTLFMQAEPQLTFDNTAEFMKRAGFADIRSAGEFISREDADKTWGRGPEDGLLYETFFEYLDRRREKTGGKPVFALLATIANHMRFDQLPESRKMLYPGSATIEQNYANSLHLSDRQLGDLMRLIGQRTHLANAIIIITSDHSYPINEHGISFNENGFYDESFRIPFLILWKGKIAPQRISDCAHSQVDIAPTILDLAAIHGGPNSFIGKSLFLKNGPYNPVYLIQPYNGTYLQSIRYPHKYIYSRKTGEEYVFNLILDPAEKNNLIRQIPADLLTRMRKDLETIYFNQHILDMNALYNAHPAGR